MYQLPPEHASVDYLIYNRIHPNVDLHCIRLYQVAMGTNFVDAVVYMLPMYRYTKYKSFSLRGPCATISDIASRGRSSSVTSVDL